MRLILPLPEGGRVKASWNGRVVAQSDRTVEVDGYCYFPADSVLPGALAETKTRSQCGYKGTATYYTLTVDGRSNEDCAWSYREPKEGARQIAGMIAFWSGVQVSKS